MSPKEEERSEDGDVWPPGQFMDERIEADTKRFVEQARELARRRAEERPWEDESN